MSKDGLEPLDQAIGRVQSSLRDRSQREPLRAMPSQAERVSLEGAAARLRHLAITHAYGGCEACALLRLLGDQEVASLLWWDALRGLQAPQPAQAGQQAVVEALMEGRQAPQHLPH